MSDIDRKIEEAIRSGATPEALIELILSLRSSRSSAEQDTESHLREFQNKVSQVLVMSPARIEIDVDGRRIQMARRIEHSISTDTVTLIYAVPETSIEVREVLDVSEIPDQVRPTVEKLKGLAEQVIRIALNPNPPTVIPPKVRMEALTESDPHADV